jgi:DNA invertase Pin-like site-specific DNA recombinase
MSPKSKRKAIGIVRVSRVNGRDGDSFASPAEQLERIKAACQRDGLALVRVSEELDVSGGTPLERRTGLRSAVESIEAGEAGVIVAAYFDRLVRSLKVQGEVVQRVERAGGSVLALDVGKVTEGTAGQWLSGTLLGAVAEYQRRTTAERCIEAQRRAIARGVPPLANIPPGYRRGPEGVLVVDPSEAQVVREAFRMRAEGAPIRDVCAYMREHRVERSFRSTQTMLASRLYLGEISFGEIGQNLTAHQPIIDADTFRRVQNLVVPRGRRANSERLLARLGVLRCGSCGHAMVVSSRNGKDSSEPRYPVYRCSTVPVRPGECQQRVAISAEVAEQVVAGAVKAALADVEGRASAEVHVREAEAERERAQTALDGAIRTLADYAGEPATKETLDGLRARRDAAEAQLEQLGGTRAAVSMTAAADWDELTQDGRRALIRATVKQATVSPSSARYGRQGRDRTRERIAVDLFCD